MPWYSYMIIHILFADEWVIVLQPKVENKKMHGMFIFQGFSGIERFMCMGIMFLLIINA